MTLGVITGDLGTIGAKLPWADESIKVAFGVENRHDKLTEHAGRPAGARDCCQARAAPTIGIEGSTNVNDVFMEASIPLVQGKTGAEQLSFDTAYRYSDYSSGITTDTYKFGADWAPVRGRPLPRELPACGACAEHRRAVHRAGLQPVRHGRRSVRRDHRHIRAEPPADAACLATGVPAG